MSDLAATLGVQPPTVTKMISRLAAQDYVERRASTGDGRQAEVFLTERGRRAIASIDKVWKRIEKAALAGIDDKDRKRLRKLLRQIERNLGGKHNATGRRRGRAGQPRKKPRPRAVRSQSPAAADYDRSRQNSGEERPMPTHVRLSPAAPPSSPAAPRASAAPWSSVLLDGGAAVAIWDRDKARRRQDRGGTASARQGLARRRRCRRRGSGRERARRDRKPASARSTSSSTTPASPGSTRSSSTTPSTSGTG